MYVHVAEELWSVCWTDVFIQFPLSQSKTTYKILNAGKNVLNQKNWMGQKKRTKVITEYRQTGGYADGDWW